MYYEIVLECTKCKELVPVNGPVGQVCCFSCNTAIELDPRTWKSFFEHAHWQRLGLERAYVDSFEVDDLKFIVTHGLEQPR